MPAIGAALAPFTAGTSLAISPAIGAAIGSGISSYTSDHSLKNALLSGAGSYAGGQIAGNVLGDKLGTVGGTLDSVGNSAGAGAFANFAGNALPASLTGSSISSMLGGQLGSDLAKNSFGDAQDGSLASSTPSPFAPSQQDAKEAPASIQGLGSLTADQQSTNLANQGVYGGGNGGQESDYFLNLINRRLVDQSGQTSDINTLKPIEQSYLQKLGLGGYDNSNNLLEAISKWQSQAA